MRLWRRITNPSGLDEIPLDEIRSDDGSRKREISPPASHDSREVRKRVRHGNKVKISKSSQQEKINRATSRRAMMDVAKGISKRNIDELDLIQRHFGVDDEGLCLRHPNQIVRGKIDNHRFETIHICKSCKSEQKENNVEGGRQMTVDVTGEVKQVHENKRQWKEKEKKMYPGKAYPDSGGESVGSCFSLGEDAEKDADWKEKASHRIAQVHAWDNSAPLNSNPVYAKYFRMRYQGFPLQGIKQACDMEGHESRVLDLNPNLPLEEQLESLAVSDMEKEALLRTSSGRAHGDEQDDLAETANKIHQAYTKIFPLPIDMSSIVDEDDCPTSPKSTKSEPKAKSTPPRNGEKGRLNILLGNSGKRDRFYKKRQELDTINKELEDYKRQLNEKNVLGAHLLSQIRILQNKIKEREKTIDEVTERLNVVRVERSRRSLDDSDTLSVGDLSALSDDPEPPSESEFEDQQFDGASEAEESDSEHMPLLQPPDQVSSVVNIGDKDEIDRIAEEGAKKKKKKRSKKRKSDRSSKRRSDDREPNLDPAFLRSKFKEGMRKYLVMIKFFEQAEKVAVMNNYIEADRKNYAENRQSSQSVLSDFVVPDDWNDSALFEIVEEEVIDEDIPLSPDSLPYGSYSPSYPHRRKVPQKTSMRKLSSLRKLDDYDPELDASNTSILGSKVTWNDEKLHDVRFCPMNAPEYFYTQEEIKLFRFEHFMEENAEEFEIAEDEEEYEEEIIESVSEYSYISEYTYEEEEYSGSKASRASRASRRSRASRASKKIGTFPSQPRAAAETEEQKRAREESELLAWQESEHNAREEQEALDMQESMARDAQQRKQEEDEKNTPEADGVRSEAIASGKPGVILDDLLNQVEGIFQRKGFYSSEAEADKALLETAEEGSLDRSPCAENEPPQSNLETPVGEIEKDGKEQVKVETVEKQQSKSLAEDSKDNGAGDEEAEQEEKSEIPLKSEERLEASDEPAPEDDLNDVTSDKSDEKRSEEEEEPLEAEDITMDNIRNVRDSTELDLDTLRRLVADRTVGMDDENEGGDTSGKSPEDKTYISVELDKKQSDSPDNHDESEEREDSEATVSSEPQAAPSAASDSTKKDEEERGEEGNTEGSNLEATGDAPVAEPEEFEEADPPVNQKNGEVKAEGDRASEGEISPAADSAEKEVVASSKKGKSSIPEEEGKQLSKISKVPEGFEAYTDSKTGKQYYYNPETKETIWAEEKKPEWSKEGNKSAEHLQKTAAGDKLRNRDGSLSKPITNLDGLNRFGAGAEENKPSEQEEDPMESKYLSAAEISDTSRGSNDDTDEGHLFETSSTGDISTDDDVSAPVSTPDFAAGTEPLIVDIGDKLEIDKQEEKEKIETRRSRKPRKKKKAEREPNLDPDYLRGSFKTAMNKLVMINRFFTMAHEAAMERDFNYDRKSFGGRGSMLTGLDFDFSELEQLYNGDEADDSEQLEDSTAHEGDEPDAPVLSRSSLCSSTRSLAVPLPTLGRSQSVLLTTEMKALRPKMKQRWSDMGPSKGKLNHVKVIPRLPSQLKAEMFYSGEEMKMFRFEKFMEDNAEEFEVVEDEELEELEEEVYYEEEEISVYTYEEETLASDSRAAYDNELPVFRPATRRGSM